MSLKAFQRALVDITLAPHLANYLTQKELGGAHKYDLSPLESERLFEVLGQPGMSVNCTIARGNRFEAIADFFPMTCVLLEPVLRDFLDEIWKEFPTNYQFTGEEDVFITALRQKLSRQALSIEYLDEIFSYELICLNLARRMRDQDDICREFSETVEFRHSPALLLPPLSRLERPASNLPTGLFQARLILRDMKFHVELLSPLLF